MENSDIELYRAMLSLIQADISNTMPSRIAAVTSPAATPASKHCNINNLNDSDNFMIITG